MRFPVDDFLTNWNTTAGYSFGDKVSYGYHEADDLNINAGGNADLGQPLYAIADGEITSVHTHTGANTFGKHLHLKFNINGKDYWAHYAHCDQVFVTQGAKVKQGDKIATVGNTGTTYAHCHFAIKNQPTGIDGLARTQEDLKKWEAPIAFIKKYYSTEETVTITQKELDKIRNDRDDNWNKYQEEKQRVENLLKDLNKSEERVGELLTQLERYAEEDKSTSEDLLVALDAIRIYEDEQIAIRSVLGIQDYENITDAVKNLKESKIKTVEPEGLKIGPFIIYWR